MPLILTALAGLLMLSQSPGRTQPARPVVSAQAAQAQAQARAQAVRDSNLARTERAYREILEKTNAQLGVWSNPYGIMVGALGVLFTVAAIVVGFVIFRQGQEYRNLIAKSIAEYQGILNAFIEEKNEQIEILKAGFAEQITGLSKDLKAATGEQKKQIAAEIEKLERLQTALKPQELPRTRLGGAALSTGFKTGGSLGFGGPAPSTSTLRALGRLYAAGLGAHLCSKCGTSFIPSSVTGGLLGSQTVACPKCGQSDSIT